MRETEITSDLDAAPEVFKDKDDNIYTPADMDTKSILEAIDCELYAHGLELLSGDYGSNNYFFCIVKKKENFDGT